MVFGKSAEDSLRSQIGSRLPILWRFALSLSGRPDFADDLVQATCLRALERAHQWKDQGRLDGWLLTICRSIWLNELRAQSVRKTGALSTADLEAIADTKPGPETNIFASEVYSRVMQLPEAQRATVELVYVEQFTYSEAAQILDVPIGTVMSRLATARATLRQLNDPVCERAQEGRS